MDVLTDVLNSLRVSGRVYCRTELTAPWGMDLPAEELAHFHVVEQGSCWLRPADGTPPLRLGAGDLVVLPHGRGHQLFDQADAPVVPLRHLTAHHEPGIAPLIRHGGGGDETLLICGAFRFERPEGHPLLALLPEILHIRGEAGRAVPWLETTLRFLGEETRGGRPGAGIVIGRLIDVILVMVVRAWIEEQRAGEGSWLGALRDGQVGAALALIHRSPEQDWTVGSLAAAVAMSRSAFAARFAALVGEPPLAYLTRWRMGLAATLLRDGEMGIASIAARVGYESEAAFSKAFKRQTGVAPSLFRRRTLAA